jgi:hypothetical protein
MNATPSNRQGLPPPRRPVLRYGLPGSLFLSIIILSRSFFSESLRLPKAPPITLTGLLQLPRADLANLPIEQLDLLCAAGLDSAHDPDRKRCADTLKAWAEHVRKETERHECRFERNPAEFENSPGFFRMLMLSVVLAEDYRIHYDPQRQAGPASSREGDGFFTKPSSVFLHGLLGPERTGTCSSLPVLYVALGRQLGYPLKLVTTKGHLFVRWEDPAERFNVEVTGHGINRFDDDYYRHWPFELAPAEEQADGYLKSLGPAEELAVFLSVRAMCLTDLGRVPEAIEAFDEAARLAPGCQAYRQMDQNLKTRLRHQTQTAVTVSKNGL